MQRKSKLTGALFLQSVVFGFEEQPTACLTDRIEMSGDLGVVITKQGLQERNQRAVPFLREMFEQALQLFRHDRTLAGAVLKPFSAIFITDSTVITLPESLCQEFPGVGGKSSEAALKIQLTFEWLAGRMDAVNFQAGRSADQGYAGHLQVIRSGALYLSDLGYYVLGHFRQMAQQHAYFLGRFGLKTAIFDPRELVKISPSSSRDNRRKMDAPRREERSTMMEPLFDLPMSTPIPVHGLSIKTQLTD